VVDLDDDLMQDVQVVITGAAHALAREYRQYTTAQDISQEMWIWVLKHPEKTREWLDRDDRNDKAKGTKALNKTLMRLGSVFCRKEKATVSGYHPSDEYFYTRTLVGALLEALWNGGQLVSNQIDDMPRKKKLDSEGNDLLALFADVDRALGTLEPAQISLLERVYASGVTLSDISEEDDVTRQAVENRVNRALDKMIKFLGGEYPY
jgi:DNA-directed RNA polymerase specialized sigma24 family protein